MMRASARHVRKKRPLRLSMLCAACATLAVVYWLAGTAQWSRRTSFRPGALWTDDKGVPIQVARWAVAAWMAGFCEGIQQQRVGADGGVGAHKSATGTACTERSVGWAVGWAELGMLRRWDPCNAEAEAEPRPLIPLHPAGAWRRHPAA